MHLIWTTSRNFANLGLNFLRNFKICRSRIQWNNGSSTNEVRDLEDINLGRRSSAFADSLAPG